MGERDAGVDGQRRADLRAHVQRERERLLVLGPRRVGLAGGERHVAACRRRVPGTDADRVAARPGQRRAGEHGGALEVAARARRRARPRAAGRCCARRAGARTPSRARARTPPRRRPRVRRPPRPRPGRPRSCRARRCRPVRSRARRRRRTARRAPSGLPAMRSTVPPRPRGERGGERLAVREGLLVDAVVRARGGVEVALAQRELRLERPQRVAVAAAAVAGDQLARPLDRGGRRRGPAARTAAARSATASPGSAAPDRRRGARAPRRSARGRA